MTRDDPSRKYEEGKQRLEEIGNRLGSLFGKPSGEANGVTGMLGALGGLIDQLGKLSEEAQKADGTTTRSGEFNLCQDKRVSGVYGFTIRSGLGEREPKVEPFGNLRKDAQTGHVVVQEIREPMTDLFDEPTHVLVVAEVPGIETEDVQLEIHDDILTLAAERGEKKYRKEMLLPASFTREQMSFSCRGGILEIRLNK